MDKNNDVFSKEYAIESSTDAPSKTAEEKKQDEKEYAIESSIDAPSKTAEEKKQDETVARKVGYYDKSKPYRVIIRAKEIK